MAPRMLAEGRWRWAGQTPVPGLWVSWRAARVAPSHLQILSVNQGSRAGDQRCHRTRAHTGTSVIVRPGERQTLLVGLCVSVSVKNLPISGAVRSQWESVSGGAGAGTQALSLENLLWDFNSWLQGCGSDTQRSRPPSPWGGEVCVVYTGVL